MLAQAKKVTSQKKKLIYVVRPPTGGQKDIIKEFVKIKDLFEVGEILEWEDKSKSIPVLTEEDCQIMGKTLNRRKIILHMKREIDGSEGNVFVRLKDKFQDQFPVSKKLLVTKKILGLTLKQFKNFLVEGL